MSGNKTAVVTGGASGIGEATVMRFAAAGWTVVIGDINVERAGIVAKASREAGAAAVHVFPLDLADETSVAADDPEPSTSNTETWRTADVSCTFDGEEYTSEAASPFEVDLNTVLSGVFGCQLASTPAQRRVLPRVCPESEARVSGPAPPDAG